MVINSPCLTNIKNWLVQKQTAFGKDFSNLFTVDSLLKTIWFSTHHASHALCYSNEALAILEQTATGKDISNPFMPSEDASRSLRLLDALIHPGPSLFSIIGSLIITVGLIGVSTRIANVAFRVSDLCASFALVLVQNNSPWCVSCQTRVSFLVGFNQSKALVTYSSATSFLGT
ncbi:hypothetical protein Tco_0947019 [Tanacetum coccineum]